MSEWVFETYKRNPESGRGVVKDGATGRVIAYDLSRADAERIVASVKAKAPDANVEAVRGLLLERARRGQAKYGVTTERTDIDLAGWLAHLQEELLDAAVYVQRLKGEVAAGAKGELHHGDTETRREAGGGGSGPIRAGVVRWVEKFLQNCPDVTNEEVAAVVARLEHEPGKPAERTGTRVVARQLRLADTSGRARFVELDDGSRWYQLPREGFVLHSDEVLRPASADGASVHRENNAFKT